MENYSEEEINNAIKILMWVTDKYGEFSRHIDNENTRFYWEIVKDCSCGYCLDKSMSQL